MNTADWLSLFALLFFGGMLLGTRLEARVWRQKAETGFRKESAGNLYTVVRDK